MRDFIYLLFCVCTGIIGYHKHHDIFWAIIDSIFSPIAWIKWLIYEEVNITLIKHSFEFFLK